MACFIREQGTPEGSSVEEAEQDQLLEICSVETNRYTFFQSCIIFWPKMADKRPSYWSGP